MQRGTAASESPFYGKLAHDTLLLLLLLLYSHKKENPAVAAHHTSYDKPWLSAWMQIESNKHLGGIATEKRTHQYQYHANRLVSTRSAKQPQPQVQQDPHNCGCKKTTTTAKTDTPPADQSKTPPHLEPIDTRASPEPGRMEELPELPPGLEEPPPLLFFDSSSLAMSLCSWW